MASKQEIDRTKLPKKVQRLIERLEGDVEYWKGKAFVAAGEAEGARAFLRPGLRAEEVPLPFDSVTFKVAGDEIEVRVGDRYNLGEVLEVRTTTGACGVHPEASNGVYIRPVKY